MGFVGATDTQRMWWARGRGGRRGREKKSGHLLWPRQGINKQTCCQAISTPTEQTGRLTNLDQIYWREPDFTLLRQVQCWTYTRATPWKNSSNHICTTTFFPFNHLSFEPTLLNLNCKLTSVFTCLWRCFYLLNLSFVKGWHWMAGQWGN